MLFQFRFDGDFVQCMERSRKSVCCKYSVLSTSFYLLFVVYLIRFVRSLYTGSQVSNFGGFLPLEKHMLVNCGLGAFTNLPTIRRDSEHLPPPTI